MWFLSLLLVVVAFFFITAAATGAATPSHEAKKKSPTERASAILAKMTLSQKVSDDSLNDAKGRGRVLLVSFGPR